VNISARGSKQQTQKSVGNGRQTMRMKSGVVEEQVNFTKYFFFFHLLESI
jgi:hypothetical protein